MIVLVLVVDAETDNNAVQEPVFAILLSLCIEVSTRVENKFVCAGYESLSFQ